MGEWLYRRLAGLAPAAEPPGYRMIEFRPQPSGGLAWAEAAIETPLGTASIRWTRSNEALEITLEIPPGAQGRLQPPSGWISPTPLGILGSGPHHIFLSAHRPKI
ncbi:alpha-L-rhamnosidase C-terminal domain-containing protein [Novosphingobium sp. PS1R-30]|uniref:Alpha-L-rhamnosidase C-terminal domain-containing protein n=1 Tax=Novosphingobium anseongense TaxID=3133436 RepID=A0ABU8RUN1_9SPHN